VKTILDVPPHLRVVRYLESKLREEQSHKGKFIGTCDCEFKQRAAGALCEECLIGCISQLKAGIGNSSKMNPEPEPVPDGKYFLGKKKNLENNA
jgi:hypothetical protein